MYVFTLYRFFGVLQILINSKVQYFVPLTIIMPGYNDYKETVRKEHTPITLQKLQNRYRQTGFCIAKTSKIDIDRSN